MELPLINSDELLAEELSLPAGEGSRDGFLALSEEVRLRQVMTEREGSYRNGFRQRAVVELALFTGAKVSELVRLRCGDIFLERGAAALRIPSDSNPRVLPLGPEMASLLEEYLKKKAQAGEGIHASDPLVCSQLGTTLTIRGWQAAWALAQKHAGLTSEDSKPLYNLEVARRVVGRRLYRAAGNPHHVQAWLGLDVTTNADRYRPENLEVTVEILRTLVEKVTLPADLRVPAHPTLRLAMGYYNGTIGVMNRHLAKRLFLDIPPEDPRGQMWIARGMSRGRCLFPENHEWGAKKAAAVIAMIRELAEDEDPFATYLYASARDEGLGCEQDYDDSARLYTRAMELGMETAVTNLALKHYFGKGVPQDHARAVELFQYGASLHEGSCMFNLGVMYTEGFGCERDMHRALRWFAKAASIGEARSMNNLSYIYLHGDGVERDERLAERWYCLAGEIRSGYDGLVKRAPQIEMIRLAG